MNAISPISIARPLQLSMSGNLRYLVESRLETDEFRRSIGAAITPEAQHEAREVLAINAPTLRPVTREQLLAWLMPLNAAVRNPQSEADLALRIVAIGAACADLPGCVFSVDSQRAAMRKFLFWPSAGDVYELLNEHAGAELRRIEALRDIASATVRTNAGAPEPVKAAPTEAEREAVAAKMASLKAEIRRNGDDDSPVQLRAKHNFPTGALEALRASNPLVAAARMEAERLAARVAH